MALKRSQIVLVDLEPVVGSEQGKTRPALVIQNNIGNEFSPVTIVAPITSKLFSKHYPTNVRIEPSESGLPYSSTILLNQIRTIDQSRIKKTAGTLNAELMRAVDHAIQISLGLE